MNLGASGVHYRQSNPEFLWAGTDSSVWLRDGRHARKLKSYRWDTIKVGGGVYTTVVTNYRWNKQTVTVTVSSLLLAAFAGPRPEGYEACHNDGVSTNNTISNLRWDTREENMKDAIFHRAQRETKGNIELLSVLLRAGQSPGTIATSLGIDPELVTRIAAGELFTSLTGIREWNRPSSEAVTTAKYLNAIKRISLVRESGGASNNDLVISFGYDPAAVSRKLASLIADGLVARFSTKVKDAASTGFTRHRLTERGEHELEQLLLSGAI